MRKGIVLLLAVLGIMPSMALRLEPIKYGDFSNWVTREVQESRLLGGKRKVLYEIAPSRKIPGENKVFLLSTSDAADD